MPFENRCQERIGARLAGRDQMFIGLAKDSFNPDKKERVQDEIVAEFFVVS